MDAPGRMFDLDQQCRADNEASSGSTVACKYVSSLCGDFRRPAIPSMVLRKALLLPRAAYFSATIDRFRYRRIVVMSRRFSDRGKMDVHRDPVQGSLIADLISGDERALSAVITTIVPKVLQALRTQFPRSAFTALEDAMAVAIMRLWQNRKTLDESGGNLSAWLYVVARNALFDELRANSHEAKAMDVSALERRASETLPTETDDPADKNFRHKFNINNNLSRLREILGTFSVMDQRILLDGASSPDDWTGKVAKETKLSPNALRVRRHRLMARLRLKLSAEIDNKKRQDHGGNY
jgi:RNA polymerase sigma factor (sigma-70 family)